jgi:hypothetical protein
MTDTLDRVAGWKEAARRIGPGIRVDVREDVPTQTLEWQVGIPATMSGGVTVELDAQQPAALEYEVQRAILAVRERALTGANAQELVDAGVAAERKRISQWLLGLAKDHREIAAHALVPGLEARSKAAANALEAASEALES